MHVDSIEQTCPLVFYFSGPCPLNWNAHMCGFPGSQLSHKPLDLD